MLTVEACVGTMFAGLTVTVSGWQAATDDDVLGLPEAEGVPLSVGVATAMAPTASAVGLAVDELEGEADDEVDGDADDEADGEPLADGEALAEAVALGVPEPLGEAVLLADAVGHGEPLAEDDGLGVAAVTV